MSGHTSANNSEASPLAGMHLLIDLYGAKGLTDEDGIQLCLHRIAAACSANVLGSKCHRFEGGGLTIVVLLSTSHIALHTWPERQFAAIDVFVCGELNHKLAADVILSHFMPDHYRSSVMARGGNSNLDSTR